MGKYLATSIHREKSNSQQNVWYLGRVEVQTSNSGDSPTYPAAPHISFKQYDLIKSGDSPTYPPRRTVPSSNTISSNQETRPPIPLNHIGPQTAPLNKTVMPSSADSIIHPSPMSGLSELQIEAVQPAMFKLLYTIIQQHLRRLQAMHVSRDRDERSCFKTPYTSGL
jgi:hypothetical protein